MALVSTFGFSRGNVSAASFHTNTASLFALVTQTPKVIRICTVALFATTTMHMQMQLLRMHVISSPAPGVICLILHDTNSSAC
jgi:hypothetical protein